MNLLCLEDVISLNYVLQVLSGDTGHEVAILRNLVHALLSCLYTDFCAVTILLKVLWSLKEERMLRRSLVTAYICWPIDTLLDTHLFRSRHFYFVVCLVIGERSLVGSRRELASLIRRGISSRSDCFDLRAESAERVSCADRDFVRGQVIP